MSFFYKKEYTKTHKIITFLGLKLKFKYNLPPQIATIDDIRTYFLAAKINSGLERFHGLFTDKDILIVGGGSSLEYLDTLPENTINIGINRAFKLKNIDFDYLFMQDKFPTEEDLEDFIHYKENTCVKMLGRHSFERKHILRNSTIARIKNKQQYVFHHRFPDESPLPVDISVEPLYRTNGSVFSALQIALYANAKRIYLAGFDCNISHMFTKNEAKHNLSKQYKYWNIFKNIKENYYEDCEIISINPINLKGMFKDVYTKSYLEAHPEIEKTNIEILN